MLTLRAFLCHSKTDQKEVRFFQSLLTNLGITTWFHEDNILPGQMWQEEIPRAVRASDVVIVFLSKTSITREGYVQKEIACALDVAETKPEGTIYVIPARLEECEIPQRLHQFQWVDLFKETGFAHLIEALKTRGSQISILRGQSAATEPEVRPLLRVSAGPMNLLFEEANASKLDEPQLRKTQVVSLERDIRNVLNTNVEGPVVDLSSQGQIDGKIEKTLRSPNDAIAEFFSFDESVNRVKAYRSIGIIFSIGINCILIATMIFGEGTVAKYNSFLPMSDSETIALVTTDLPLYAPGSNFKTSISADTDNQSRQMSGVLTDEDGTRVEVISEIKRNVNRSWEYLCWIKNGGNKPVYVRLSVNDYTILDSNVLPGQSVSKRQTSNAHSELRKSNLDYGVGLSRKYREIDIYWPLSQ